MGVDEAIEHIAERGQGRWTTLCVCVLSINATVQALETNLLPYLGNCATIDFHASAFATSTLFSAVFVGLIGGAFIFAPMADVLGRRAVLVWTTWALFVCAMLSAFAPNFATLVVLRVLVGVMEGAWTVSLDLLAEFVPVNRRGFLLNVSNLGWGLGSVWVSALAWLVIPALGWRVFVAAAALPMAVSAAMMLYLEESPRWLAGEGRTQEAYEVLQRVAAFEGMDVPCDALRDHGGDDETSRLAAGCAEPSGPPADKSGVSRMLEQGKSMILEYQMICSGERRGMMLLVGTIWAAWGFAYSGIVLYEGSILGAAEDSERCSFKYPLTTMLSTSELWGAVVIIPFIDLTGWGLLAGRRGTQAVPYAGCALSTLMIGLPVPGRAAWAFLARGLIAAGVASTVIQVSELFDTKVRATANGLACIVGNIAGVAASYWVLAPLPEFTIILGFAMAALLPAILMVWVPETAKQPLAA